MKPDASAFRDILRKLKVQPQEAVMVDDREVNTVGAETVGMNAILYKNAGQFRKELARYDFV